MRLDQLDRKAWLWKTCRFRSDVEVEDEVVGAALMRENSPVYDAELLHTMLCLYDVCAFRRA